MAGSVNEKKADEICPSVQCGPLNYLAAVASTALAFFSFLAFFAFLVIGAAAAGAAGVAATAGVAAAAGVAGAAVCAAAKAERENRPATRAAISFFIFYLSIRQFGLIFRRFFRITACNGQKEAWLTSIRWILKKELKLFVRVSANGGLAIMRG
jgi:hypothetical protein